MRFYLKPKKEPKLGNIRVIEKFCLFPVWIGNEIRWLEKVKIKQECIARFFMNTHPARKYKQGSYDYLDWVNGEFIN